MQYKVDFQKQSCLRKHYVNGNANNYGNDGKVNLRRNFSD